MKDVESLYQVVKKADLKIPLKGLDEVKASVSLRKPLAISDYLEGLNPYEPMTHDFKNEHWDEMATVDSSLIKPVKISTEFRPTLTDAGVCATFNAPLIDEVFQDHTVSEFREVFLTEFQSEATKLETAAFKEYTFIIDTQKRGNFPFRALDYKNLARYVNVFRHLYTKGAKLITITL